ncbi:multicopper oxidase domain-containing protein [Sediminibacterium ginsengisoli]|uniref:Copper-resistance protein, CopA family n=1 Tax=Sediminibacterium ginsengisoli TaxID=413434 RepID=A0A1T4MDX2_9BACT|nr:multicopper oxidase domain-containing protein [Sediminibacterium ginsengisoli]SJZ65056.1 copper-resistance protein, CopA family [Sediminibacterium ginsengisoli]
MRSFLLKSSILLSFIFSTALRLSAQRVVRYDLHVKDTSVNYTGKQKKAIAINGTIPAPELHFTEDDTAEIYVHNGMKVETSVHWHGLILPNRYDGVPYLTTAPIRAGETRLFRFPLVQNGTYWYHSHTSLQEQSGMYGPLIIHKREPEPVKEYTILLSDWSDEKPYEIHRRLHNQTDWYAIRKGSTQDYAQAVKEGHFKTKLTNEWKRMLAMDVSDVYYERFLINGKTADRLPELKAGEKIKIRVINGSASTYFWLRFAGGKMTVVANDGKDVVPVDVDRMMIAVSETYDVMVTIPDRKSYELMATAEDRTGSASLWLGSGDVQKAGPLPRLQYFEGMKMMNDMMKMNGSMNDMGMQMSLQQMDMNTVMYPEITGKGKDSIAPKEQVTLNYAMLRSPESTRLPAAPVKELRFELTGNMNRYVWSLDNKTVSETDKIMIRKGENLRIILYNGTMMRHPMHLHGHFFRVLNGQGDNAPLKTVLDIMPMETDTLEFAATETGGDWFFHCHILYHMMSGMGRIFSYENSAPNPEIPDPAKSLKRLYRDDRSVHPMLRVGLESSGSDGEFMLSNTRYQFQTEWRVGFNSEMGYESESHFGRYFGKMQFLYAYAGWDIRYRPMGDHEKNLFGQINTKNKREAFCVGVQYLFPMLVTGDLRFATDGKLRIQFMREDIPLSSRLRLGFMWNTDKEYMGGVRYILNKSLSISSHYDSDMGFGAGITFSY